MATLKIVESILTKNPCYAQGRKLAVKGLMLHSVGCPQPGAAVFVKQWNDPSFGRACVHGFIDGNTGEVYQTLPWDMRGWHAGGSANDTHIGVEMCEPACIRYTAGATFTCSDIAQARAVATRTYEAAVLLFAMLCEKFSLDPLADGVIISHAEGNRRGVASNHADPEHLWRQLSMSYTMDGFRQEVKRAMGGEVFVPAAQPVPVVETGNDKTVWDYLYAKIGNAYGVAGMMGNLYGESGMKPTNLQNSFETKLGMDDAVYTAAVDNGIYGNFVNDGAGYGLAQWTYPTRKSGLSDFAKARGVSIGDLAMQLDYLWKELSEGYSAVMSVLRSAKSVTEASTAVLTQFERPADQGEAVQARRAGYGQTYYNRFAGSTAPAAVTEWYRVRKSWEDKESQVGAFKVLENAKKRADENPGYGVFDGSGNLVYSSATETFMPFLVKVEINDLNIRTGPGTNYNVTGQRTGIGNFTILEVRQGAGAKYGWGRLKSGVGWISLDFATRL